MAHARRRLRNTALGSISVAGGVLAAISVVLPPPAEHSEAFVIGVGAVATAIGLALLFTRRRLAEPLLGLIVALGTVLVTVSTWAGGAGNGTAANQILYVWMCLYSFYFLSLRHALTQLAFVGFAYAWLLGQQGVPGADASNQWLITLATLAVVGFVVAGLRDSLNGLLAELGERARHDSLTGLLNRHELEERGAAELARIRRDPAELALIALDLDGFKALNDSLGHPAGDEMLRCVARVLDTETRQIDAVARVGGDEFVVVLPGAGLAEARNVAHRLLVAIRGSGGPGLPEPTVSMGVAVASAETTGLQVLWAAADEALYVAKRAGGDRVAVAEAKLARPALVATS